MATWGLHGELNESPLWPSLPPLRMLTIISKWAVQGVSPFPKPTAQRIEAILF